MREAPTYSFTRKGSDPCLENSAIVFGRIPDMKVCQYEDAAIVNFRLTRCKKFLDNSLRGIYHERGSGSDRARTGRRGSEEGCTWVINTGGEGQRRRFWGLARTYRAISEQGAQAEVRGDDQWQ